MRIVELDRALAIERDGDVRAGELHQQRVPGAARDRGIDVLQRVPPAFLRVIERDVILQRIGARDVVVPAVLEAQTTPPA